MCVTIREQAQEIQAAAAGRLPTDVLETFGRHVQSLRAAGVPEDAVSSSDVIDDFTLPDATGADVSLSSLLGTGPAVLVFYRGGWCPFCNLALREYQRELLPQLGAYGANLVAISPQTPDESMTTSERHDLGFPVLSDTGGRLARRLGIAFEPEQEVRDAQRKLGLDIRDGNSEGTGELPMPTVLVVDRDRTVRFADVNPDYTARTEASAILTALGEIESQRAAAGGERAAV